MQVQVASDKSTVSAKSSFAETGVLATDDPFVKKEVEDAQKLSPLPLTPQTLSPVKERAQDVIQISTSIGRYAYSGQLSREEAIEIYRSIAGFL